MIPFKPTPVHLERQAQAEDADRRIPSAAFSDDVRHSLYKYALIRNSWGTTNIDAGPIDLERVTQLYEAYDQGRPPPGKVLPTEIEVVNYFRLVDDLPTEPVALSRDDIRLLHQDYFREVPLQNDAKPGHWKTVDNEVVGPWGILKTTPKERVEEELATLLQCFHREATDLPVLVRAALFFHEFQRIHPFGDGNGRVGRLATLQALSAGGLPNIRYCPIDDAINEEREEYYRTLSSADHGNREPWVNFFTSQVVSGFRRSHLLGRRLQRIPSDVGQRSRRFLEHLYIHKVNEFRPADARRFFVGTPRRTFARRLAKLEELRLVRGTGRGAGRRYEVASLVDVEQRAR